MFNVKTFFFEMTFSIRPFQKNKTFNKKSDYNSNGESGEFEFTQKKRTIKLIYNSGIKNDMEKNGLDTQSKSDYKTYLSKKYNLKDKS